MPQISEEQFEVFHQQDGKLLEDGYWIEVAATGTIVHPLTGQKKTITTEMLSQWKQSYDELAALGNTVPVVDTHSKSPADKYGLVKDVRVVQVDGRESFQVQIDWLSTVKGDAKLAESLSKSSISPWFRTMVDDKGIAKSQLMHVGVTDYPVLKGLRVFSNAYFSVDCEDVSTMLVDLYKHTKPYKETNSMDIKKLCAALDVTCADTATEEDVAKAVNNKQAEVFSTVSKNVLKERKAYVQALIDNGSISEEALSILDPFLDESEFSVAKPKTEAFHKAVGALVKVSESAYAGPDDEDEDEDDEAEMSVVKDEKKQVDRTKRVGKTSMSLADFMKARHSK